MCEASQYYDDGYDFASKFYTEAENMPADPAPAPDRTPYLVERLFIDGKICQGLSLDLMRLGNCVRMYNAQTFRNNVYFGIGSLSPDEQRKLLGNAILALYASTRNTPQNTPAKQLLKALTKNE